MDAMEEFIAENADSDKINKKALERVNKVLDKAKELAEALGRNVTVAELAEETGLSEKAIRDAMRISGYKIDYIEG
jgi:RNA polymerase primary sigma factor